MAFSLFTNLGIGGIPELQEIMSSKQERYDCGLMAIIIDVQELRKRLGIKKLKKRRPISEFEKAAVRRLREDEKRRLFMCTPILKWLHSG